MLLLDPELAEEKQAEVVQRARDLIEKGGGTFERHDVWGRRRLAYEINKKAEGSYHLLTFSSPPETLDEISRVLKIDDTVMRHLATRRPEGGPTGPVAAPAPISDDMRAEPADALEEEERMAASLNRVVIVGNLTRDPECVTPRRGPRSAPCGSRSTAGARTDGQWSTSPTTSTSPCSASRVRTARSISRRVARSLSTDGSSGVSGRSEGGKREAVEIVAETVQFLGSRGDGEGGGGGRRTCPAERDPRRPRADFPPSPTDDDIPF